MKIKWQKTPKYKHIDGEYAMVWNSAQKTWQPIAKDLPDKDIEVIRRAWNDWLWIDANKESPCPWETKQHEHVEDLEVMLDIGTPKEDIIKQLKKLPKFTQLSQSVILQFEHYK